MALTGGGVTATLQIYAAFYSGILLWQVFSCFYYYYYYFLLKIGLNVPVNFKLMDGF